MSSSALLLGACGTSAASKSPPRVSLMCTNSTHLTCLNATSNEKTIRVHRGGQVGLSLGGALNWSGARSTNPTVLRSVGSPTRIRHTYVARYNAIKIGAATIEATGSPICSPGTACPQFVMLYRVTVDVTA